MQPIVPHHRPGRPNEFADAFLEMAADGAHDYAEIYLNHGSVKHIMKDGQYLIQESQDDN